MKNFILSFLVFVAHIAGAQLDEARRSNFNIKKNIAIEGYDPVSYFENKPVEGESKWTISYKGVAYRFSSLANQNKFKSNPDLYEPAYGGWCAFAMGDSGEKVKIDPETFKIADGKLYLFYNFWGNNTLRQWNKNEKLLKAKADSNWNKILH
jgi:YHS domain-containing protein